MALTYEDFEAIWAWVPPPHLSCPIVGKEPPSEEEFKLVSRAGSPTPSESPTEVFWTHHVLTTITHAQLVQVASCHLISLVPRALSKRASSQELVQGFLSHMYDHGFLLRTFVMAAWVLSWVPRTEAFAEEWRLMCPKLPMLDLFDADDPEGLDYPSIIGSKYLLPSYFLPLPRTPNHRSELLILSALIIAARSNKPDDRREYQYWTLNVASGLWSPEQFSAAEKVMSRNLRVNMVRDEELEFFAGEMERMAGKMGVLGG